MFRYVCVTLFLVLGSEIQLSCSTEVSVYDASQKLCLYAKLNVSFTVTYEASGKINNTVKFPLPEIVNSSGSTCDKDTSLLMLRFEKGHSWSVSFTKENKTYNAHDNVFAYNLGDDSIFKNASSKETRSVTFDTSISDVAMDTYYSCKNEDTVEKGSVVQSLWNVSLQAFVVNGTKSDKDTVCARDKPTTPSPTTHDSNSTTPTSAAPVTNITTPAPTSTPSPLPTPAIGNYSLKTGNESCLLASMGLQISFKDGGASRLMNVDPANIDVDGMCSVNKSDSSLVLRSEQVNLTFTFKEDGKKFLLHAVNVIIKGTNGTSFSFGNNNLSLWEAGVGSSYMCNKEQSYNITDTSSLKTFHLHVQPFAVTGNVFATAHECAMDDAGILIPIVVGAALAGLIFVVLIVYAIGRRKTTVGYQTL